jgi:hypothetical protein
VWPLRANLHPQWRSCLPGVKLFPGGKLSPGGEVIPWG